MRVEFVLGARLEFHDATEWYEARGDGLGSAFAEELKDTLILIAQAPDRWRCVEEDVRRCLLRCFPYAVLYTIEADCILVLAVMHSSREPGYWKDRLK
jgi:toxin ParE1/3/4